MKINKETVDILIERYSNVGRVISEDKTITKEGVNWLHDLEKSEEVTLAILFELLSQKLLDDWISLQTQLFAFSMLMIIYRRTRNIYDINLFVAILENYIKENNLEDETINDDELELMKNHMENNTAIDKKLSQEIIEYYEEH